MPAVLKRLVSDACSDEIGSPCEPVSDCETPLPKKRRLSILSPSAQRGIDKPDYKERLNQDVCVKASFGTIEDFASSSPSRRAGLSEHEERRLRMRTSDCARQILRGMLGCGATISPAMELTKLRAQALACHYVQLFFMSVSLDADAADSVALAACLRALKDLSVLCCVDDLLRIFTEQRAAAVQRTEQRAAVVQREQLEKEVLQVEARMASLVADTQDSLGVSRPMLPLDFVKETIDDLVGRLPECDAFRSCCTKRNPARAAKSLRPQLREVAQRFAVDAMLGPASVVLRPVVVARAAVAIAARYLLHQLSCEVTADELMHFFVEVSGPPGACVDPCGLQELRCATREVFGTYKLWLEQRRG
eukprot:TRINITY_DN2209_c0_g1_i2.p1 TRINITY_DN2209_c0_g1~~TRINITY_DN2209_c0_g1_i2.p1  ORF type:complete len:363 (+),score=71.57 TRINITY_DN2209_c0_g1_i2:98-1186(+)